MTTRPSPRTRRLATACALAALSALGGCVVAPAPAPGYGDPYGYPSATDVYAPVAPPAPEPWHCAHHVRKIAPPALAV